MSRTIYMDKLSGEYYASDALVVFTNGKKRRFERMHIFAGQSVRCFYDGCNSYKDYGKIKIKTIEKIVAKDFICKIYRRVKGSKGISTLKKIDHKKATAIYDTGIEAKIEQINWMVTTRKVIVQ